ncbi:MAG: ATP-binding protein [Planctomycetes bacterium]|nr:ATP-binding protein [Planctomycetota bacterium]
MIKQELIATERDDAVSQSVCTQSDSDVLKQDLVNRIGSHKFEMWFGQTAKLDANGTTLVVTSSNQFVADWIEGHFLNDLKATARNVLGQNATVEQKIDSQIFSSDSELADTKHNIKSANKGTPQPTAQLATRHNSARASRGPARKRLEDFVVGPSNELAYCAAKRIAEERSVPQVSPLFIHGECGVGKTHLLQGSAIRFASRKGPSSFRYVTAEQFTNEYITAVRTNKLDRFRKSMRSLDLLAIDDVHFLSNKTATQNEFLYTLDAMNLAGSRVVMASDEHPHQMRFNTALISRFVAGMVVEIQQPDRQTRLELTKRLAASRGMTLTDAASQAIVSRCISSVREIQGAINKLAAIRTLRESQGDSNEIGTLLIEQLFSDSAWRPSTPLRLSTVIEVICERLGVNRADLLGSGRHQRVVLARGLVAHLGRSMTTLSYPEIAHELGRRHHSTVHTAAKRVLSQLKGQKRIDLTSVGLQAKTTLAELVDELKQQIIRSASKA